MNERPSVSPRRRRDALAVVFVVALAVRLWGISGVLPFIHHPDEIRNERIALRIAHAPFRSPDFFNYPSLLFYAQALIVRADEIVRGAPVTESDFVSQANARATETAHWVLGRGLTALVSATTAMLSVALALSFGASLNVALVAGLSVAVSPLAVEHARYVTPDSYAALFCTCVLVLSARIARRSAFVDYVLAGLAIGAAAGSKYNAALVAIAVVLAHCLRERGLRLLSPFLFAAAVVAVVAFFATTPFALFDYPSFRAGVAFEAIHYRTGHPGSDGNALGAAVKALWGACGLWLPCALAVPLLPNAENRRGAIAALAFSLLYVAFLSSFTVHFDRNVLPVVASFTVLGVLGAAELLRRAAAKIERAAAARLYPVGLYALATLLLVVHAAEVWAATRASVVNQRALAEHFAEEHLPAKSRVVIDGYGPWLDPKRFSIRSVRNLRDLSVPNLKKADYAILSEELYGRFTSNPERFPQESACYELVFRKHCELAKFTPAPGAAIRFFDLKCNR